MVHAEDVHSNKSTLIPPPLSELERLAHQSRLLQRDTALANACGGEVRNLRRRLAPQTIEELVSRYQAGDGTPMLCRDFGLSKGGILQLLRSEGVPMRKQAMTSADAQQPARLYERGLSIADIVAQIG